MPDKQLVPPVLVAVSALCAYLAGWLWYAPAVFGRRWAAGVGLEINTTHKLPLAAMAMQLLATLAFAYLVALTRLHHAYAILGCALLSFIFMQCASGLFSQKNRAAILIEVGYSLLMLLILWLIQVGFA
jgi:hypothetical protein